MMVSGLLLALLLSGVVIPIARVYAQVDDRAKASAAEAISKAEVSIKEAQTAILKGKDIGAEIARAESFLTQASKALEDAKSAQAKSNYESARTLANQAIENAVSAQKLALDAYQRTLALKTKAEEQIAIASKALAEVSDVLAEAEKKGLNVSRIKNILHEVSGTLEASKKALSEKNYGRAIELSASAFEMIGKARVALSLLTNDIRSAERVLIQVRERLGKIKSYLAETKRSGPDAEKAQARLEEAVNVLAKLEAAYKNHDNATFQSLYGRILEILGSIETLIKNTPVAIDKVSSVSNERVRFEEIVAKIKRIIEEARKILNTRGTREIDAKDAQKKIEEIVASIEKANVAFKEGDVEKAYAIVKEAYEKAERLLRLGEKSPDRAEAAAKELREAYEKIKHAEKIVAEMKQAKLNTSRIEEVLKEATSALERGYAELKKGNATLAYSIAKEAEHMVEKALGEIKELREKVDQNEVSASIQRTKRVRQEVQQKIEKAKASGINMVPIQNVFNAANDTLAKAEEFLSSGQSAAAHALAKVAEKLFVDASRLIDVLTELAKRTEVARSENKRAEKIRTEKKEDGVQVDSDKYRVKLNLEIPRIVYSVKQGEKSAEFLSRIYSLVEFNDKNEDKAIQDGESLQRLVFSDIKWDAEYKEEKSVIVVTYRAQSERYDISLILRIYQDSSIEFFKNDQKTVVYSVDGGAREVKFDLVVTKWPWMSNSSSLALRIRTQAETKGELKVEKISDDEHKMVFDAQGLLVKVKWVPKAIVQESDGVQRIVDVGLGHRVDQALKELDVDFVYPNFRGLVLLHDPSIGVAEPPAVAEASAPAPVNVPSPQPATTQNTQTPSVPSDTTTIVTGAVIIAAIVGITIVLSRRRK